MSEANYRRVVEERVAFRLAHKAYGEAKSAKLDHPAFADVISTLREGYGAGVFLVVGVVISKARYDGWWLRSRSGAPASTNFLRNYLIRKGLELLFSGTTWTSDHRIDLVIDRVHDNPAATSNLKRYLNGEFAEHGSFEYPPVDRLTFADSELMEGLQIAHHVARLVRGVAEGQPIADEMAKDFLYLQSVISGRPMTLHDEAKVFLERQ